MFLCFNAVVKTSGQLGQHRGLLVKVVLSMVAFSFYPWACTNTTGSFLGRSQKGHMVIYGPNSDC